MLDPKDLPVGPEAGRIYKEAIKAYERERDAIEWRKREVERKADRARLLEALEEIEYEDG
jgi:hypothetical protein